MLFSLFYTFVYYLWVCTDICVHTGLSQSVQENNYAIIPHLLPMDSGCQACKANSYLMSRLI